MEPQIGNIRVEIAKVNQHWIARIACQSGKVLFRSLGNFRTRVQARRSALAVFPNGPVFLAPCDIHKIPIEKRGRHHVQWGCRSCDLKSTKVEGQVKCRARCKKRVQIA